jgi:protein lifeguard
MFFPFSRTFDLILAIGGCLIFSGYIVYDTYLINNRLSPDEFIMGAISLYLECVIYLTDTLLLMLRCQMFQLHQSLCVLFPFPY